MGHDISDKELDELVFKIKIWVRRLSYIFLIIGSIALVGTSIDLYRANASTSWSSVGGVVVDSGVSESSRAVGTISETSSTYKTDIVFHYIVNEKEYTNDTIRYSSTGNSERSEATYFSNKYPIGEKVTVYFSQYNPEVSVLEPGIVIKNYFAVLASIFIIFVGLLLRRNKRLINNKAT